MLSKEDREAIMGASRGDFPDGEYQAYIVRVDELYDEGYDEFESIGVKVTLDVQVGDPPKLVRQMDYLKIRDEREFVRRIHLLRLKELFAAAGIDVLTADARDLETRSVTAVFKTRAWRDKNGNDGKTQEVKEYKGPLPQKVKPSIPKFLS